MIRHPLLLARWFGLLGLSLLVIVPLLSVDALAAEAKNKAGDTKFSKDRGLYEAGFAVEISSKTPGALIYFTTNGTAPSLRNGHLYTSPVKVGGTTVLRAAAFQKGMEPSDVDTQTYIFLPDVLKQTGSGHAVSWGTNKGAVVRADYEMDPEIVNHSSYRAAIIPALKDIPSLSIVMAKDDLFGPASGIYANPMESGVTWERPASVELIYPKGTKGFQIDCGIRIQGGWNRRPEESPKHSLRLLFKKKYGPGKLKYPLFGQRGVREFDTVVLRAGCNNTWLHWSAKERVRGDFIRDQWMRDTLGEMGHPSARGVFVHLYLNGLYWGIYNLTERPSAPFVAAHLGGEPEDYDVRNGDEIVEGDDKAWKQLMSLANAGVTNDRAFAAVEELVDIPQLIDFMLINFYGANADWDRASNWYAARRRQPPGKYQFYIWDGERALEDVNANSIPFDDDQCPPRLFHKLKENPKFAAMVSERARKHLTNGGPLTPQKAAQRYSKWAKEIETAVVAESARWGDYRRDAHAYKEGPYQLYTRDDHWRPEIRRLLSDYFPQRTDTVLKQLRAAHLVTGP